MAIKRCGCAQAPGTCGELVQGTLDGVDFLVTCPIDIWSRVEVFFDSAAGQSTGPDCARRYAKTAQAVVRTLAHLGYSGAPPAFRVTSALPRGKGLASSTADVAAACVATARALGTELSPDAVADIALSIEPSDGLMFPGVALFDHRWGRRCELLGQPPPMDVLILDPGGAVDTLAFNRRPDLAELNRRKEAAVREALALVQLGLARGDPAAVGAGATLSAQANQALLTKPLLEPAIALGRELGAVGVAAAHSGTALGLLFDRRQRPPADAASYAARRLDCRTIYTALVGGGII